MLMQNIVVRYLTLCTLYVHVAHCMHLIGVTRCRVECAHHLRLLRFLCVVRTSHGARGCCMLRSFL